MLLKVAVFLPLGVGGAIYRVGGVTGPTEEVGGATGWMGGALRKTFHHLTIDDQLSLVGPFSTSQLKYGVKILWSVWQIISAVYYLLFLRMKALIQAVWSIHLGVWPGTWPSAWRDLEVHLFSSQLSAVTKMATSLPATWRSLGW